ncbi:MAG: hypothetical protein IT370_36020 [Deltaproteobacteria bacterium]|nr:hypothetical protein [Deltaproteobacteria bacterium]
MRRTGPTARGLGASLALAWVQVAGLGCMPQPRPALPRVEHARIGTRLVLALAQREAVHPSYVLAGFALDTLELTWQLPRRFVEEPAAVDETNHVLWVVRELMLHQGGVRTPGFQLIGLGPERELPAPYEFGRELCPGRPRVVLDGRAVVALAPGGALRLFEPGTGRVLIGSAPALEAAQCGDLELVEHGSQLTLRPLRGATLLPTLHAVATVDLDQALRSGALELRGARPALHLEGPENALDILALSPDARWLASRITGTGLPHLVISDVATGRRAASHQLLPGAEVVFTDARTVLVATHGGVQVIELAHGESRVVPVGDDCCQRLIPVLGGQLWWARGATGGTVFDPRTGRSRALQGHTSPIEVAGALWALEGIPSCTPGTQLLHRISADLALDTAVVPGVVTRILGATADRLLLIAECQHTLELASYAPATSTWLHRPIPVGRLGMLATDD